MQHIGQSKTPEQPQPFKAVPIPMLNRACGLDIQELNTQKVCELSEAQAFKPYGAYWGYYQSSFTRELEYKSSLELRIMGEQSSIQKLQSCGAMVRAFSQEEMNNYYMPVVLHKRSCEISPEFEGNLTQYISAVVIGDKVVTKPQLNELFAELTTQRNTIYRRWYFGGELQRISAEEAVDYYQDCFALHRTALLVGLLSGKSVVQSNYEIGYDLGHEHEICGLSLAAIGFSAEWEELMFPVLQHSYNDLHERVDRFSPHHPLLLELKNVSEYSTSVMVKEFSQRFGGVASLGIEQSALFHRNEGVTTQCAILRVKKGHFNEVKKFIEEHMDGQAKL